MESNAISAAQETLYREFVDKLTEMVCKSIRNIPEIQNRAVVDMENAVAYQIATGQRSVYGNGNERERALDLGSLS